MGLTPKDNVAVKFTSDHPYITAVAAGLIALLLTGGQLPENPVAVWCTTAALAVFLVLFTITLKIRQELTHKAWIVLIFAAGFALKLIYILYTDVLSRQNDVGTFEEGVYNLYHSGYILFVRDKMTLPDIDVTKAGQFYHPPFHYIVSAAFLKIYELISGGRHNYESLQILTLIYSTVSTTVAYKILTLFDLKENVLTSLAIVISFFPEFILLAGSVNNDCLCVMLTFISFYLALRWYRSGRLSELAGSGISAGLAMMTKMSAALIAVPLAVLFVARLIKSNEKIKVIGHTALFALLAIPAGIWFPLRNLIRWNVPLGYVLKSENIYQDISRFSVTDRLFGLYPVPVEDFFMNLGSDGQQDYNTTIALFKTAMFSEWNYRDSIALSLPGYFLLWVFIILVLLSLAGLVYMLVTIRKRDYKTEELSIAVLFFTELVSYTTFCLKFPHICSMNFRYTVPLIICGTYFAGRIASSNDKTARILRILAVSFAVLSAVFYILLFTYVKGEVIVSEVTW